MAINQTHFSASGVKPFLDDNFLLENDTAAELYHDHAAGLPLIDYHGHLSPEDIATNRSFKTITEIWLEGDHYKWRAMRANGVPERYITGDAPDVEKFEKWAETVPATLRNPLYHWTHLELRRYFGIETLLHAGTAGDIYRQCGELLSEPTLHTQGILRKMNVEVVCTTDDPADSLEAHRQFRNSGHPTQLLPSFRPDKAILLEKNDFPAYIGRLGAAAGIDIRTYDELLEALCRRMDFFAETGCRLSDHGLETLYAADFTRRAANSIFQKRIDGKMPDPDKANLYHSALLYELGAEYARRGWTQQFHLGALRNNNSRLMAALGPDTGFDSIGDFRQAQALARFLDRLDREQLLARTILYNLNPADNAVFATMCGNFNDGTIPGKMQWGSAWWFLDQKDGMEQQLTALSNFGLLARFVGMLTDSRSFMSFPRHEYFRRILCNLIGRDVQRGELPQDMDLLGRLVRNVCYFNAKQYFNF